MGLDDSEKKEHPSYGMLEICRTSGKSNLNGSSIEHQHFYTLRINRAHINRSLNRDWWHSTQQLIEIKLSPNQLVDMISNMNTSGIPCTLSWLPGEGRIQEPPADETRQKMHREIKEEIKKIGEQITALSDEVDILLSNKSVMKKAQRERLQFLTLKIKQAYSSNLSFVHKSQEEHLEKVISQIGAEVESNIASIIRATGIKGIETLIGEVKSPLLEHKKVIEIDHE